MSQSVLCPVLIGRAVEFALLEEQLRQATEGTGRAVLVTGDAGIGKSRLVAELVTRAGAGGAQVLTGACAEGELTASFLPFVEAIGNHLALPDPGRGELGAFRQELARLMPSIAAEAPPVDPSDPAEGRLRLFDAVLSERAALYVGGDLFDFWFEYGHTVPKRYIGVLQKLGELRRAGLPVTYVGGNHDFWIGDYLRRELDVTFTDEPLPITLQGRRILLAHGDGLGPGDHGYKFLKRVLRNGLARWLFRWIHPDLGIPLATASRTKSPPASWRRSELARRVPRALPIRCLRRQV